MRTDGLEYKCRARHKSEPPEGGIKMFNLTSEKDSWEARQCGMTVLFVREGEGGTLAAIIRRLSHIVRATAN